MPQCKGRKKDGDRCSREVKDAPYYCFQHEDQNQGGGRGERRCGNCRQPGHDVRTCPDLESQPSYQSGPGYFPYAMGTSYSGGGGGGSGSGGGSGGSGSGGGGASDVDVARLVKEVEQLQLGQQKAEEENKKLLKALVAAMNGDGPKTVFNKFVGASAVGGAGAAVMPTFRIAAADLVFSPTAGERLGSGAFGVVYRGTLR
jgi:hypothetical protein